MTRNEVFAQLVYAVRVAVDGVVVHSKDLHYTNPDGTPGPEDINEHPYTATFQAGGHSISITARGWGRTPSPPLVHGRAITVTSDAPFLMASIARLNQIITYDGTDTGYGIYISIRELNYRRAKGANTAEYESTDDLQTLWDRVQSATTYGFGGYVFVNLHFCTHLPLRDRETGQLLRDITTGKILRDD